MLGVLAEVPPSHMCRMHGAYLCVCSEYLSCSQAASSDEDDSEEDSEEEKPAKKAPARSAPARKKKKAEVSDDEDSD